MRLRYERRGGKGPEERGGKEKEEEGKKREGEMSNQFCEGVIEFTKVPNPMADT